MNSLFSLSPAHLANVDVGRSVEIFRDLLWCHARKHGVPITKIHITSRVTVSDGGIDAKIADEVEDIPGELLVSAGTGYQIKTGTAFRPWQQSQLHKELFGSSSAEITVDNLDAEVKRCLEQGNSYILVCFGLDPTVQEINRTKKTLIYFFNKCGFANPKVDVWGQTHLVGLLSEFPSIVLKVLGKSEYHFQTHSSWASNDDMRPSLKLGEPQEKWLKDFRDAIRTSKDHLRVIGEPGIGKSRLVLEVLAEEDLKPNVIYISNAEDFQKSQLFNEMIRSDLQFRVILVVDECPNKERASIWNVLKAHRTKCQLITIDHGPERSSDEAMRVFHCPALDEEQISAIINSYIQVEKEAKRWASWCSGSPRVAHAVGQNLKNNPEDIFKPPATVPIWERFIAGYEEANSESNQERLTVLRHVALFQRFGFEAPVSDEAKFIAEVVGEVYPNITWGRFQSIIEQLRERRILQGKTTLFLVPKALHTYLWLDYWKHHGRGFDFKTFIERLPEGLRGWFARMFIYAHANPLAHQVVKDILVLGGPYDDEEFLISELGTSLLSVLAEADPRATLKCIERTFGAWSKEKLQGWDTGRQNIVWALEKIAVWADTFRGAARILIKLGVTETSNFANNASGTFSGLFSLAYGPVAPTEASPPERLPVLEGALRAADLDVKKLGMKACEAALSTYGGARFLGAEYQGLKPAAKLWMPKIYGEIFDAYRVVWNLLLSISRDWPTEERSLANNILVNSANGAVQIDSLASNILTTIEELIDDAATDIQLVVSFIVDTRRFRSDNLADEILDRINKIDAKNAGSSLEQQINRYVINSTWSEERDEDIPEEESIERRIEDLAERTISEADDFLPLLAKLTRVEGHNLFKFAIEIAKKDDRKFLTEILGCQRAAGAEGTTQFLGGYLRWIKESSEGEWEKLIIEMLFDKDFQKIAGQLVWRSGVNDNVLKNMLDGLSIGIFKPIDLRILRYPHEIKNIDQGLIEKAILKIMAEGDIFIALEITESLYYHKGPGCKLNEKIVFDILKNTAFFEDRLDNMQAYYWGRLAEKFLKAYPSRDLELFGIIMGHLDNWRFMLLKSSSVFHSVAVRIVKNKPNECWKILEKMLSGLESDLAIGVVHWLEEEGGFGEDISDRPITLFDIDDVFNWIEVDPGKRALVIVKAIPSTFDPGDGGEVAKRYLEKYGHIHLIKNRLLSHFYFSSGWSGPESEHFRAKRDKVRAWLDQGFSQAAVDFLRELIDNLTAHIEEAEIEEERRY